MAAFEQADFLLEGIEQELQQRIDVLLEVNENYRDILYFLENTNVEEEATELGGGLVPQPSSSSEGQGQDLDKGPTAEDEGIILNSQLDDILMKAKTIRERAPLVGSKEGKSVDRRKQAPPSTNTDKRHENTSKPKHGASSAKIFAPKSSLTQTDKLKESNRKSVGKACREKELMLPPPPHSTTRTTAAVKVTATTSAVASTSASAFATSRVREGVHATDPAPMYEAVDTLLAMQLSHPLEAVMPSKALLLNQTQLLSQLLGRPSFPPSALLNVFMSHFKHFLPAHGQIVSMPSPDQCARFLKRARSKFERMIKLNKLGVKGAVHTLVEGEVLEICALWWNVHRCILVYEKSVEVPEDEIDMCPYMPSGEGEGGEEKWACSADEKRIYNENYGLLRMDAVVRPNCSSAGSCAVERCTHGRITDTPSTLPPPLDQDFLRLQALCRDLISSLPLCSYPLPTTGSAALSVSPSISHIQAYHDQVHTRVCYAMETSLSKLMLRPVLQAMKECVATTCAASEAKGGKDGDSGRHDVHRVPPTLPIASYPVYGQWVTTLQLFQGAHQMLAVNEKQRNKKVLFFKKDIKTL